MKLNTAEAIAAEKEAAASRAAQRAEEQEAEAANLQRELKQTKQDAAQMQEALERELETTSRLVCATAPPTAMSDSPSTVHVWHAAEGTERCVSSSMVNCAGRAAQRHRGGPQQKSGGAQQHGGGVCAALSGRNLFIFVIATWRIRADPVPVWLMHPTGFFTLPKRCLPAQGSIAVAQEVQVTSQDAIEKLEAAKQLAEEEAAAERASRERMLAAMTAGELPGLQRAATAASEGDSMCPSDAEIT